MNFIIGNRISFAVIVILMICNVFGVSKMFFPWSYILEIILFFLAFIYLLVSLQSLKENKLARFSIVFSIIIIVLVIWAMFI